MIDYFLNKTWQNADETDVTYEFTVTVTRTKGENKDARSVAPQDPRTDGAAKVIVEFPDTGWGGLTGKLTGTLSSENASTIDWTDEGGKSKGTWSEKST